MGWWRRTFEKHQKIAIRDRSLGYAFYLMVAIFPFDEETSTFPTLIEFIDEITTYDYFPTLLRVGHEFVSGGISLI